MATDDYKELLHQAMGQLEDPKSMLERAARGATRGSSAAVVHALRVGVLRELLEAGLITDGERAADVLGVELVTGSEGE